MLSQLTRPSFISDDMESRGVDSLLKQQHRKRKRKRGVGGEEATFHSLRLPHTLMQVDDDATPQGTVSPFGPTQSFPVTSSLHTSTFRMAVRKQASLRSPTRPRHSLAPGPTGKCDGERSIGGACLPALFWASGGEGERGGGDGDEAGRARRRQGELVQSPRPYVAPSRGGGDTVAGQLESRRRGRGD